MGNNLTVSFPTSSSSSAEDSSDLNGEVSDSEMPIPCSFLVTAPKKQHHGPITNNAETNRRPVQSQNDQESTRSPPQIVDEDWKDGNDTSPYQVHGGMLRLARAMGSKGKPVHEAVSVALSRNPGYGASHTQLRRALFVEDEHTELVLCGHSLGAGVASLLALVRLFTT